MRDFLDVLVMEKRIDISGQALYVCAVVDDEGKLVNIGETYPIPEVEAETGDILRVSFLSIEEHKGDYTWRFPVIKANLGTSHYPESTFRIDTVSAIEEFLEGYTSIKQSHSILGLPEHKDYREDKLGLSISAQQRLRLVEVNSEGEILHRYSIPKNTCKTLEINNCKFNVSTWKGSFAIYSFSFNEEVAYIGGVESHLEEKGIVLEPGGRFFLEDIENPIGILVKQAPRIKAEPIDPKDLEIGDLYSRKDQGYWDKYQDRCSIGERVYIRTSIPKESYSDFLLCKISIEK